MAGVEHRVILEDAHRGGHRVQARAAALQDGVAGVEGGLEAGAVAPLALGRERGARGGTGAAMDGNGVHACGYLSRYTAISRRP